MNCTHPHRIPRKPARSRQKPCSHLRTGGGWTTGHTEANRSLAALQDGLTGEGGVRVGVRVGLGLRLGLGFALGLGLGLGLGLRLGVGLGIQGRRPNWDSKYLQFYGFYLLIKG